MHKHGLVLDFTTTPITVRNHTMSVDCQPDWKRLLKMEVAAVPSTFQSTDETVDDCAVPIFDSTTAAYDLPKCNDPNLLALLETYKQLFNASPGRTTIMEHFIPTTGNPIKVPPRRVPVNYHSEVQQQINTMLQQGIIEPSSSPWMAPAVFVRKKNGEIRLCVDYRELNKRTVKDAYLLPRPDEVQDRLMGSTIFSTLDLRSGYWQLPVHVDDQPKTAFCPGPGFGLFQFRRMPFGLSGAPASFQRLINMICYDLSFVTTYLDDLLVHSKDIHEHVKHLEVLLQRMHDAGLTFRGSKCQIGLPSVTYLGHIFSATGMSPDPEKVSAVSNWPSPNEVGTLRSFLGLASYYRRYIHKFSDIAAPLYHLTNKNIPFVWDDSCQLAFTTLKNASMQAPILKYPDFSSTSKQFQASNQQKQYFDKQTLARTFSVGDPVWLSIPTAGKLDPKWEGEWIIQSVVSPTTYTIHDGLRTKTVHIDRLRQRIQATTSTVPAPLSLPQDNWAPPLVEHHFITDDDHKSSTPRYPTRERRQPDRYQS